MLVDMAAVVVAVAVLLLLTMAMTSWARRWRTTPVSILTLRVGSFWMGTVEASILLVSLNRPVAPSAKLLLKVSVHMQPFSG